MVTIAGDPLALTVLALLSEGPRHTWELQQLIHARRKDFALPNVRGLYRMITRLSQAELIEVADTTRQGNRPERTVYRLTSLGTTSLRAWLTELVATHVEEFPIFTVAVGLLAYLPTDVAHQALQRREAALRGAIATLETQLHGLSAMLPRILLLELEHARVLRQAELTWVSALIADIHAGRLDWDELVQMVLRESSQTPISPPQELPQPGHEPLRRMLPTDSRSAT